MRRTDLPRLAVHFSVADALAAGVSRDRLRARDLDTPFWGARARGPLLEEERLRLLLSVLPSHAFACGATAAAVHRLPLPVAVLRDAFGRPSIGVPAGANRIRRAGTVGRSVQVAPDETEEVNGLRVTSLARTWRDLATILPLPRFVAVTDALLSWRRPRATLDELHLAHERAGRSAGAAVRRQALEMASPRSESPRESELRVLLVVAGLPLPDANVDIFDGRRFVARVDLLFAAQRLIVEYDGDHHRDAAQWSRDQSRRAELESLGYRYTTVTARDFDDPAALIARIRRLLSSTR
jgi:hypothetical protein